MRPLLLDLFCGAGGAAMGYRRAGFDVVGVDIEPQPHYPFTYYKYDALALLTNFVDWQDSSDPWALPWKAIAAIHASPPCQGYSRMTVNKGLHSRLIPPTRELLRKSGLPYVIENVEGAQRDLIHPVKLCGSSFGLGVRRHRYFETSFPMFSVPCQHYLQPDPIGVYGDHPDSREFLRPNGKRRGAKATSIEEARDAMAIEWMDWPELTESIPPAYTEYIGTQLLQAIRESA